MSNKRILLPVLFVLAFVSSGVTFPGAAVAWEVPRGPLVTVHRSPSSRCVGAVIGTYQVITAGHCAQKNGRGGNLVVRSSDGRTWEVESWELAPDFPGQISDDIAVLQMKQPIGRELGKFKLDLDNLRDGADLLIPVPRDSEWQILRSKASVFKTWLNTDRIVLDIRARPGDSGTPVLRHREGVVYEVVGVLSGCFGGEVVAAYIGEGGHHKTTRFLAAKVPVRPSY